MLDWIQVTLVSLVALIVLDATVGRWLLALTTTFRFTQTPGDTPESKRLLVYLPGTLFDGDESVAEIKHAMLAPVAAGMFVSYGFWRFIPKRVTRKTAAAIGDMNDPTQKYTSIVLVGASFGGRVAADVSLLLQTQYGWRRSSVSTIEVSVDTQPSIAVIAVDTPCETNSFLNPGRRVSLIMRWVFAGPIVSIVLWPILRMLLVPPYDEDIEVGEDLLDVDKVKQLAVKRMARFMFSAICDQQRYLADNSIEWVLGMKGLDVVYLSCDRNNITVLQPAARNKLELYLEGEVHSFASRSVASPHCGFLQLRYTWAKVLREVLEAL